MPSDVAQGLGYAPTVSATPASFEQQMAFVRRHFNVISLDELIGWTRKKNPLPWRPLLITFDDGYRDTYEFAWPVLKNFHLPSVLFVASDYIGGSQPFDWDLAAYCFQNTTLQEAALPLLGQRGWKRRGQRDLVMHEWIRTLLSTPDDIRRQAVASLAQALAVAVPPDFPRQLLLDWDEICAMQATGMAIGSHTHSHAVLDRITHSQVRNELTTSSARIVEECGQRPSAFAFPNGVFNSVTAGLVEKEGFDMAFTTEPGPCPLTDVMRQPWTVRRVGISRKDGLCRFLAKLMGLVTLKRRWTAKIAKPGHSHVA